MKNLNNIQELLTSQFNDVVVAPLISVPYTTIVNRKQIKDFSLKAQMGVERIMTQQLYRIPEESGPNGEAVQGIVGDRADQIRFVGSWGSTSNLYGSYIYPSESGMDTVEVSFYGTGINLLFAQGTTNRDVRVTIDGGSEGANIIPVSASTTLVNRGYSANSIVTAISNLTLGFHTVKLRNAYVGAATTYIYGFEILNENSQIAFNSGSAFKGGSKEYLPALTYSNPKAGVTGTRGANVVKYLKDGVIGQVVQETDSAAAYLTNANHSNEELVREYNWREFGCGRADDFSLAFTTGDNNRAFTLDDNLTTLVCYQCRQTDNILWLSALSGFITITFFGTGLDVIRKDTSSGTIGASRIIIDGNSPIAIPWGTCTTVEKNATICSGLTLGTHTVKIERNSDAVALGFVSFKVYAPKTPSLPVGAIALSQYYVLADYVANTVAGNETIATGVIRKQIGYREAVYVGTWTMPAIDPTYIAGGGPYCNVSGSYSEYTFIGTGFEFRTHSHINAPNNFSILLNGLAANTTNFPTLVSSYYGGFSYSGNTLSTNLSTTFGSGLRISGLPYGKYVFRITNNTTSNGGTCALDIITPIYSPKYQLPYDFQNTLTVGNNSLQDLRKFDAVHIDENGKAVYVAKGVTSGPTTSSASAVPCPDMSLTVYSKGGMWDLSGYVNMYHSTAGSALRWVFYVDGVATGTLVQQNSASGYGQVLTNTTPVYLSKGQHKVDIYWYSNGSVTITADYILRQLTAKEL